MSNYVIFSGGLPEKYDFEADSPRLEKEEWADYMERTGFERDPAIKWGYKNSSVAVEVYQSSGKEEKYIIQTRLNDKFTRILVQEFSDLIKLLNTLIPVVQESQFWDKKSLKTS